MTIAPPINFPLETAAKGTGIKVNFAIGAPKMPLHSDIKVEKQKSFFKLFFDMLRIVSKLFFLSSDEDFYAKT